MPDGRRTRAARLARPLSQDIDSIVRPPPCRPASPPPRRTPASRIHHPFDTQPMRLVYVEWCRFHTPRAARDEGGYHGVRASVLWANYTSTMTDEGRSAATRVAARVFSKATAAGHGLDSRPSLTSSQDNAECRNATAVEFCLLESTAR